MNLETLPLGAAYVVVFGAAVMEGETVLIAASALAAVGTLDPLATWLAGALGGSAGDQCFFYLARGPLRRLDRWLPVVKRHEEMIGRVRRHQALLSFGCRFMPGLRIAIPVMCAHAGVPAARFTICNLLGGLAWAGAVMATVAWAGPRSLAWVGLGPPWNALVPAVVAGGFFWWLTARLRK